MWPCEERIIKLQDDKNPHVTPNDPQNVSRPREVFEAAGSKQDGVASAVLERALAVELVETQSINELVQELEAIVLCDEESDDIIDEGSSGQPPPESNGNEARAVPPN
ncbi:hypothetical protein H310_11769 [Aphanomyces invadans]|uniref:Uncharacterized protein n=1 Tax=Aphanomyces invadans TaxID=157072 RepID=A0A024TLG2_9STRA|nr:hypothetical protein H310_11769 [Aphanomyces invadans]ETV94441.1 hypothetical protein H310_11769 [Aphanomyces invadans]|eukprot:XP_008876756.1 hypothetical protein H310_11769 [Aphanomyces invadans]